MSGAGLSQAVALAVFGDVVPPEHWGEAMRRGAAHRPQGAPGLSPSSVSWVTRSVFPQVCTGLNTTCI